MIRTQTHSSDRRADWLPTLLAVRQARRFLETHANAVCRTIAVFVVGVSATGTQAAPAADLWTFWYASNESSDTRLDHRPFQAFLDRYLESAPDGINRVNYARVTGRDRDALNGYIDSLAGTDPRRLHPDEQYAYWINLYNALTVEVVLRHPDKKSILRMGKGLFSIGPWDEQLLEVAGQQLTLNDIEHRILRPIWRDHRVHFAVNCASLGCPNLSEQVYTRNNVHDVLDASERRYVNHPRGVRIDERGRLYLSRIFDWYSDDFGSDDATILAYLADRHPTLGDALRGHEGRIRYEYDWDLNAVNAR